MDDCSLCGKENSMLGALEEKDSLLSAGRHLPALLKDACSHLHRGRWYVLSCLLASPFLGAGAGIRFHWWEVPRAGVWEPLPAFCPGVGGLEPQAEGCHPAKPRGEETESGIVVVKCDAQGRGIHSALFSIFNSKENHGMECKKSNNGNIMLTLSKSHCYALSCKTSHTLSTPI